MWTEEVEKRMKKGELMKIKEKDNQTVKCTACGSYLSNKLGVAYCYRCGQRIGG